MRALVTGAQGYVGAHVVKALVDWGYTVDSLDVRNSRIDGNDVSHLVRQHHFFNVTNDRIFLSDHYDVVVHAAALVSAGESVKKPAAYAEVNVMGTDNVTRWSHDRFVLISTVTAADPQNPYALSKRMSEYSVEANCKDWSIVRLSNVAGSVGFKQVGPATHLIRVAARAALGVTDGMSIFGYDYDTPDGTCLRDYVHVGDVAATVARVCFEKVAGYHVCASNVDYSCLEVVNTMKRVTGVSFPVRMQDRRPGDPVRIPIPRRTKYCPEVMKDLETMCETAMESER